MGCGCNKNRSSMAVQKAMTSTRPMNTPQTAAAVATNVGVAPNNIRPMSAAINLPPPPPGMAESDKRRIQKLRQQAIQKSLGRLS
jgi:hypothetical protein